jgi:hypothetical protein
MAFRRNVSPYKNPPERKKRQPWGWIEDEPVSQETDGDPPGWWELRGAWLAQQRQAVRLLPHQQPVEETQDCAGCGTEMPLHVTDHCQRCRSAIHAHRIALERSAARAQIGQNMQLTDAPGPQAAP